MALRAIHAMQGILEDVEDVCPHARIFNYTNPVNVLAQAVTSHSDVPFVSLCEGPSTSPIRSPAPAISTASSSRPSWSGSTTPAGACGTTTRAPT